MQISWKDVVGYEENYKVNNYGEIVSKSRRIYNGKGYYLSKEKTIKQVLNHKGYPCVYLSKDGKDKYMQVHRIVAQAFIPNLLNKPQVNHKNGIKTHNRVENLEWCTNGENQKHAWSNGLQKVSGKAGKPKKSVLQIDTNTNKVVAKYNSIAEASRAVGCKSSSLIGACCRKQYGRKTICGYKWEFEEKEVITK